MSRLAVGDTVWHYVNGQLKAVGPVLVAAVDAQRPPDLPASLWGVDGRLARVDYHEAAAPPSRDDLPRVLRLQEGQEGPFQRDGQVKTGYLYPVSAALGNHLAAEFGPRFPGWQPNESVMLPAEAQEDATTLLRRLLGVPMNTITGRSNKILEVHPPDVLVATERSPQGRFIPIESVQEALTQLRARGRVVMTVEEVGYRSSFVGAVLLTLPGTSLAGEPPTITLQADVPGHAETQVTFEGALDQPSNGYERGEQSQLRRRIFGSASTVACALCGHTYPVQLLHAAHIKRRSLCTDEERRDLTHVAMPACILGCDALFEMGFIAVGDDGRIVLSPALSGHDELTKRAKQLEDRLCSWHTAGSAPYFRWHRNNRFLS
jgi:hypothetical protein